MSEEKISFMCYNRGCGKKFYLNDNKEDSCQYHTGYPVFHDAYKSWSCCKKKCTDFSEFLNIQGCTKSQHSNLKPPEPSKSIIKENIQYTCKPLNSNLSVQRPSFDSPQILLKPIITPKLLEQVKKLTILNSTKKEENKIVIGDSCKHNNCKSIYKGQMSNDEICVYHPGTPVFHEGMKYWSCCKKKTTEFNDFLEQPGCFQGVHMWIQKDRNKKVNCRMDWHQTESDVIVTIFAKEFNPELSYVKLNPIHLTVNLYFPEDSCRYNLDIELKGIVNIETSYVTMSPIKVEIKMKKEESGSWSKLEIAQKVVTNNSKELCTNDNVSETNSIELNDI